MKSSRRIGRLERLAAMLAAVPVTALPWAVVVLAALASCERVPVGKAHIYKCSEGVVVRVVYSETNEAATVRLAGKTYRLKLVPSGSGAKYSDGKVDFWNKGDEAVIMINGELVHDGCRLVEQHG